MLETRFDDEPLVTGLVGYKASARPAKEPRMSCIPELPEEDLDFTTVPKHNMNGPTTEPGGDETAVSVANRWKTDPDVLAFENALGIFVDPSSSSASPLREPESPKEPTKPGFGVGNGHEHIFKPIILPDGNDWRGKTPPKSPAPESFDAARATYNTTPKNKIKKWWNKRKAWFRKQGHDIKALHRKLSK